MRLGAADAAYLSQKSAETIRQHAAEFIATRLALARPHNDGKQTPWRGYPSSSPNATATCCRSCLEKWHDIEKGRELTEFEREHVVDVITHWLSKRVNLENRKPEREVQLF